MNTTKENPELLSAYMDGELPAEEAEKIKAHVLTCPLCGRELQQLERLKNLFQKKIQINPAPPALKSKIRLALDKKSRRAPWVEALLANLRAPAWALLAVIILIMVIGWGYYQLNYIPRIVSQDIADRHLKCARGPIKDFYQCNDIKDLDKWYQENLAYRVSLPRFRDATLNLMGGKRCHVAGMYVAHNVYSEGEKRISLFVLPQGTCSMWAFKKIAGAAELYHTRIDQVNILFWRSGSMIYALAYEGQVQRLKNLAENYEIAI